jgi:hypothetical protein
VAVVVDVDAVWVVVVALLSEWCLIRRHLLELLLLSLSFSLSSSSSLRPRRAVSLSTLASTSSRSPVE